MGQLHSHLELSEKHRRTDYASLHIEIFHKQSVNEISPYSTLYLVCSRTLLPTAVVRLKFP